MGGSTKLRKLELFKECSFSTGGCGIWSDPAETRGEGICVHRCGNRNEEGSDAYTVSGPSPASPFPHCLMTELYLSLVADSMERATVDRKAPASSALLSGYKLATCRFTGTV